MTRNIPRRRCTADLPRPLILLVEDEASARSALETILMDSGYRVLAVGDGEEALSLLDGDPPDLVVSDVNMPRTNGFELAAALRARSAGQYIPIILVSGLEDSEKVVAGLDLGADDYVGKPIDPPQLLARIRVHLRHANRYREALRASLIDELTGVLNRRGLLQALERELARAREAGEQLSVVLVDINEFKQINDRFGHDAGDAVLRAVGRSLSEAVRSTDLVGRLGGDELLVIVPDADAEKALMIARRLGDLRHRPQIARLEIDRPITIAAGAATYHPGEPPEQLIRRADQAMYRDKHVA